MRPSAENLSCENEFAWEWKIISMSQAKHLTSFWYRGPGKLGNGLFDFPRGRTPPKTKGKSEIKEERTICFLISQPRARLPLRSINLTRFLFSYARSTTSNRENGGSVNRLLMAFSPEFSGLFRVGSVFSLGVSRHLDAPAVESTAGASRHPSLEAEPMYHLPPGKPTFLYSNFDQGIKRYLLSFHATLVNGSLNFIRLLRVVFSSRSNRLKFRLRKWAICTMTNYYYQDQNSLRFFFHI